MYVIWRTGYRECGHLGHLDRRCGGCNSEGDVDCGHGLAPSMGIYPRELKSAVLSLIPGPKTVPLLLTSDRPAKQWSGANNCSTRVRIRDKEPVAPELSGVFDNQFLGCDLLDVVPL